MIAQKKPPKEKIKMGNEVGKHFITYEDVKKDQDIDGWVIESKWRPIAFDLVTLKGEGFAYPGWWDGSQWIARKMRPGQIILYWKREIYNQGF